jgi:hypothetical protein
MDKIIDYVVVSATSAYHLAEKIRIRMRMGWQPFGSVVYGDSGRLFLQGMVQYEKTDLEDVEMLENNQEELNR